MTHRRALGKRPPTHSLGMCRNLFHTFGKHYIIPCHACLDFIAWHTSGIESDIDSTGGIIHYGHLIFKVLCIEFGHGIVAEFVITKSTDSNGRESELSGMKGKVCRRPSQFSAFGKFVPQCLANTYNVTFHCLIFLVNKIRYTTPIAITATAPACR